ncbi:hypothetical protein GW17_00035000, partial [Ensete ventricosum]
VVGRRVRICLLAASLTHFSALAAPRKGIGLLFASAEAKDSSSGSTSGAAIGEEEEEERGVLLLLGFFGDLGHGGVHFEPRERA